MRNINLFLKRFVDLLGSGLGIIITLPIMICAMILIKITMPGPVFFMQKRVGKGLEEFSIIKFRNES